jgi:hypothetical protein
MQTETSRRRVVISLPETEYRLLVAEHAKFVQWQREQDAAAGLCLPDVAVDDIAAGFLGTYLVERARSAQNEVTA